MDSAEHLRALRAETARFAEVLAGADLDRPVAACDPWTLEDLARHLGSTHRFAAGAVRDGRPGPMADGPAEPAALAGWYAESAAELIDTLAHAGPDAACWTLAPPAEARFWSRRQLHETLVHRWDAETSQGVPGPLDVERCLDGIDEVVAMFLPRQVRLGRMAPLEVTVELRSAGRRWVVGDGDPEATLSAPPDRLLLLLWGRLDRADPAVEVVGGDEVVHHFLTAAIVP